MASNYQRTAQREDVPGESDRDTADETRDPAREGRAALLDLLADLLLSELDGPLAQRLAADPALNELLQPPTTSADLALLRSEYARLFLLETPPYASLYLDSPPVLGGEATQRWESLLTRLGYQQPNIERAAAADHAGLALRALARAERDAAQPDAPSHILAALLQWLPQALTALERQAEGTFYGRVAGLTTVAVCACAALRNPLVTQLATDTVEDAATHLSADDELRTLARWLATPVSSGWRLSSAYLRGLGRALGVGVGMVERERMLEQVFEASGLDERTPELLDALLSEWASWSSAQTAWADGLHGWAPAVSGWGSALARCQALLLAMREKASDA